MPADARGLTLIELTVALAVLGISLAVAGVAVRSLEPPRVAHAIQALAAARERAVREGRAVVVAVAGVSLRFDADGSARGRVVRVEGLTMVVDPLTGRVSDAAR